MPPFTVVWHGAGMDLLGKLERNRGRLPLAGMGSAGDQLLPLGKETSVAT